MLGGRRFSGHVPLRSRVGNTTMRLLVRACGGPLVVRDDDKPETIKRRLDVYAAQTEPLIAWYDRAGKLRRVNGAGEVDVTLGLVRGAMAG